MGNRREAIQEDDADRTRFLDMLGQVALDFDWIYHAYRLTTNHYPLVIETLEAGVGWCAKLADSLIFDRAHGQAIYKTCLRR